MCTCGSICFMKSCQCECHTGILSCVQQANLLAITADSIGATIDEMKRFEEFINPSKPAIGWEKYRILMTNDIKDMTGKGEEWLMSKQGEVVAKFFDGAMVNIVFDTSNIDTSEDTVITG